MLQTAELVEDQEAIGAVGLQTTLPFKSLKTVKHKYLSHRLESPGLHHVPVWINGTLRQDQVH